MCGSAACTDPCGECPVTGGPAAPLIGQWLKGSTVRKADQVFARTDRAFWQDESCGRWIR